MWIEGNLFEWIFLFFFFLLCFFSFSLPVSDCAMMNLCGLTDLRNIFPTGKLFDNDLFKAFWPENTGTVFKLKTNPLTQLF